MNMYVEFSRRKKLVYFFTPAIINLLQQNTLYHKLGLLLQPPWTKTGIHSHQIDQNFHQDNSFPHLLVCLYIHTSASLTVEETA